MNEATYLLVALVAGTTIGVVFFVGLWWTIRRALSSRSPAALFLASLLLRTLVAVSGFYLVSRGDWRRLLACMGGFFIARVVAMRLARPPIRNGSLVTERSRL